MERERGRESRRKVEENGREEEMGKEGERWEGRGHESGEKGN